MFTLVTCPCCRWTARVLAGDLGSLPRCPVCGQELTIAVSSAEEGPVRRGAIEDEIPSWLSEPGGSPAAASSGEATCLSCGYEGLMELDSARGDRICPACLAVYRTRTSDPPRTAECPGCGASLEISDRDRGKTIICPGCKYFLGCVLPAEKHTYRRRRTRG
jgi:hypothetical protein